ncbi:MAG: polyprenyl synthetase family protein [Candidatus Bathyarchaeota archaeon]|nr:polyprenyl synthetase family protein [Candidatus Bathyarchaeota archaeon]MDH5713667.1 polyprenyl synthetase family protein [Candidatus Bathyarchaeota archaeon]
MGWEETLDQYGVLIDEELRNFFTETKNAAKTYHPFIEKVYSNMKEFVLRKGKRLASCSTLLTYKGYTSDIDTQILKVCVGIELYRHSILVHDDFIDKDEFRRGGKTFHRMFSEDDRRLGDGTAVFTGDMMYSMALRSIVNSGFAQKKLDRVLSMLLEGYRNVNESQILDLLFECKEPNADEWYVMASKRAASLFKTTILVGAVLGNAPEADLQPLGEAATHLGYSFDIQDDIIDTFASLEQYGRPPGGDLALGKKPLHVIYTLKLADRDGLNMLMSLTGKEHISLESLEQVREVIRGSGGLKEAKEKSRSHAEKAKKLIAQTGLSGETKEFFASLITYIENSLNWYR